MNPKKNRCVIQLKYRWLTTFAGNNKSSMEKITKDFVVLVQLKTPFESDRYFQPSNIITKKCAIEIKLTFN